MPTLTAVAMSGGVDSSVAACLLHEQGHSVVGVTMKLSQPKNTLADDSKTCCTLDSSMDAQRVCAQIGVPHYTLDMISDFRTKVIDPFFATYLQGRTPNPCVDCNSFVKWSALWDRVRMVGAEYLATGHYARVDHTTMGIPLLARGQDLEKDQSYFLWGVPPETVGRTLFPVAALTKAEVRAIAHKHNLRTANKPESMDICFIPDGDKDKFLREQAAERGLVIEPGPIVDESGRTLGVHKGLAYHTVGQRKGLGISSPEPLFVLSLQVKDNALVVGPRSALAKDRVDVGATNWFVPITDLVGTPLHIQIRHRSKAVPCHIEASENGFTAWLEEPASMVTPGQSAVVYKGDLVVAGGIIH